MGTKNCTSCQKYCGKDKIKHIMKKYFAFRKNTGGFHARTRLGCYLFSCTAVAAALLLAGAELSGKITMGLTAACRKSRRTSVQPVDLEGLARHMERYFNSSYRTSGAAQGHDQAQGKKDTGSGKKKNPLDMTDMFESYMGWK